MRSGTSRFLLFGFSVFICLAFIGASLTGLLSPLEGLVAIPIGFLQGASSSVSNRATGLVNNISDYQSLQERNAELERALIAFQSEIVQLREIKADYPRLVGLLNYKTDNPDSQYLAATVIGRDTTSLLRTITIDRGTRDGLAVGMPVVTELGLVGRITAQLLQM